ncbi:MAG: DUF3135 domain-containing protein [Chromatiales bacterium]|nr:DUF3135 domain-containing protein [Chromatiales bacterium]
MSASDGSSASVSISTSGRGSRAADPFAFEARRLAIDRVVPSPVSPPDQRRLRGLQFRIDMERRRARTPMAACLQALGDDVGLAARQPRTQERARAAARRAPTRPSAARPTTARTASARVLPFRRASDRSPS